MILEYTDKEFKAIIAKWLKPVEERWRTWITGGEFKQRSKYLLLNQAEILELKIKAYEMKKSLNRFYMIFQSRGKDQVIETGQ